ncbi:hypothetical protein NVP1031O_142 [Vibrio phage 1.031.O._10N.261.46.F8]|nr:hypothetical protein NVP1031O_142 [Vibrio phage 1.031.O._10N.261.46.F8]
MGELPTVQPTQLGELPTVQLTQLGDGTKVEFDAPSFPKVLPPEAYEVTIDGFQQTPTDSYVTDTVNKVKFNSPVPAGGKVSIQLRNIQEVAPYGDATTSTIIPVGGTEADRKSIPEAIRDSRILPTSATGQPSGSLWNDSGTVTIVP